MLKIIYILIIILNLLLSVLCAFDATTRLKRKYSEYDLEGMDKAKVNLAKSFSGIVRAILISAIPVIHVASLLGFIFAYEETIDEYMRLTEQELGLPNETGLSSGN